MLLDRDRGIIVDNNDTWSLPMVEENGVPWDYGENIDDASAEENDSASHQQAFQKSAVGKELFDDWWRSVVKFQSFSIL